MTPSAEHIQHATTSALAALQPCSEILTASGTKQHSSTEGSAMTPAMTSPGLLKVEFRGQFQGSPHDTCDGHFDSGTSTA